MSLFPSTFPPAVFSPCRTYRLELSRIWGDAPYLGVIGLNPSTADETRNDPTIRRDIGYAKAWRYGGLFKCNLYAYRSTDPAVLKNVVDPVGPGNDAAILALFEKCKLVIAAWGNESLPGRAQAVCQRIADQGHRLHCLRVTKEGQPGHTLYLPKRLTPIPFEYSAGGAR